MKIYSKKLTTIGELKREKLSLKKKLHSDKQQAASAKDEEKEGENQNFLAGLLSGVTSGSIINTAINVAPTLIDVLKSGKLFPGGKKMQQVAHAARPVAKPSIVTMVAKEFIGGYVKWKALELAYKGIRIALKSDAAKSISKKTGKAFKKAVNKVSKH
ncbi:MAG TPA: hypothetical protein VL098_04385 [Flavipsychrobacter sp.]|nr:hypothetical protein [Flavipsychrobacter sp.]